ncbi:hypothetical protein [Candidatus Ishikawella capsulata]|nr:hypothetical protein [Candidatus Ishikawaella capsulata]
MLNNIYKNSITLWLYTVIVISIIAIVNNITEPIILSHKMTSTANITKNILDISHI